ncbi:MAG: thioredoxin [Herbinix sp.]|jgi:thioredoxin-like negative regulator of GroEL|nr:thioredoxin [Herbinix sp.]
MREVFQIEEIENCINQSDIALVYFTGSSCIACEVIRSKLEKMIASYSELVAVFINAEKHPAVTGRFNILSVPQFFVYVYGKPTIHEGRNFDFMDFERKLNRYYEMVITKTET